MKKMILAVTVALLSAPTFASECPSVLKFVKRKLNSQETVNLCSEYQGKTLLIVNTASYCGFTPQFEGLEAMYEKYKDKNFAVLGFPSHDFNQEAKDEGKTAELCELTYGVKFPMFEPIAVKGDDADPLYRMLSEATGEEPSWNFNKYLVDKDGNIVKHYGSRVKPTDETLVEDIERSLAM
ncbi:glutathione peroxidase [Alteromonas aestuariivivens]|uniref:Glutathione peroxidase n=1 Tax=Alteromonas aestuariivivens TaxID=1938339 RepID=A0A3D8MB49_9ALTE|nr:glutathione peroxidase [Alteromonas aestuariivivens]RDV27351.1 glutathione peroxidase [Alteromonas aestuariivivens]